MAHFAQERSILRRQIEHRLGILEGSFFRDRQPITGWESVETGTGQGFAEPPTDGWEPYTPGTGWGGNDITRWFRTTVTIPNEMAGEMVVALLEPGAEGMVWLDGIPWRGIDPNRPPVELRQNATAGDTIDILVETYTSATASPTLTFSTAHLAVRDPLPWDLYWDLMTAYEITQVHEDNTSTAAGMLELISDTIIMLDFEQADNLDAWHPMLGKARAFFKKGMKKFEGSVGWGMQTLAGHSHIDVAWQWPLRETERKVGRTVSTCLRLLDEYPDFRFVMSQPQLYVYLKDFFPELYEQVREYVKQGRWEITGAAWLEQDTNVPSGESHIRQYLYGNRFFRKEFGIHTRIAWLPDCFGFSFSMPQIMKKSQIDYFGSWKLLDNEYNRHPYTYYRWRGIDGTEIESYMLPTLCAGEPRPSEMVRNWTECLQKGVTNEMPYVFGHGDGGGGPMREMLERVPRMKNAPGVPKVRFGQLIETMDRISKTVDKDSVPVFHDEMYFEMHRGCQTTQANTKKNNRKSELLARDAELFASMAMLNGTEYPSEAVYSARKLIMLNQFHDILPGTSIHEVYEVADQQYAQVRETLGAVRDDALGVLIDTMDTTGDGRAVVVFNSLSWERTDIAEISTTGLPAECHVLDPTGKQVACQRSTNADGIAVLLFECTMPSMGHAVYRVVDGPSTITDGPKAESRSLCNDQFSVRFDNDGTISSVTDLHTGREIMEKGAKGNELQLFNDRAAQYDAWDIDFNANDERKPNPETVSVEVLEEGPVRATVRVTRTTGDSTLTQDISVWRSLPRIDVATHADWHEKRTLLKTAFPVDISSRKATYEIQFGAIERPTHWSTTQDRARFEVTGHRWIDLSENGYGVSLLNDCKYGFDVHDNVMRISLLRSTVNPDTEADMGEHWFTYSLYPHEDSWQSAETVRRAYELNVPLVARATDSHAGVAPAVSSLLSVDAVNVVVDTVKKAEDSDALIVRLYEAHGARGSVTLSFGDTPVSITECDLMEENDTPVSPEGNDVVFNISPWEIRTFKVFMPNTQG
jgi:alpha-mannosidase